MDTAKIQIINKSSHPLPSYATIMSAGLDLRASISNPITLNPMQRVLVPTGLFMALPQGTEAQIRPRSGFACKEGVTVLNAPGTVDADYRGEVKVLLINLSEKSATINSGDRIAQMVIAKYLSAKFNEVDALMDTERSSGGFGSTGKSD